MIFVICNCTSGAVGSNVDYPSILMGIIIGGLVSGISLFLAQILIDHNNRPILEVDKKNSPITTTINMESGFFGTHAGIELDKVPYIVNRIRVMNKGKTAAENCKAVLEPGLYPELMCWSIPRERYVITINAKGFEYIELCAVAQRDHSTLMQNQVGHVFGNIQRSQGATLTPERVPRRIAPSEEGWQNPIKTNRSFDTLGQSDLKFKLTITARNASPCVCNIIIKEHQDGEGRIVSFPESQLV